MAIAFRAVASNTRASDSGGNKTLTISKPAGTVDDDVMIAVVSNSTNEIDGSFVTPPAGWTSLGAFTRDDGITYNTSEVLYKIADAEPASYAFTVAGGNANASAGIIASYSGVALAPSPIADDAEQANANGTSATAPSVTAVGSEDMLVCCYSAFNSIADNSMSYAPPAGMTERADVHRDIPQNPENFGLGADCTISLNDQLLASAGATGSRTATLSEAATNSGFSVALRSGPAGLGGYHMML